LRLSRIWGNPVLAGDFRLRRQGNDNGNQSRKTIARRAQKPPKGRRIGDTGFRKTQKERGADRRAKGGAGARVFTGRNLGEKSGSKGMPKYANPANPDQTWTGRGRQPGWVKEALGKGKSLDDLAI
jgi:DNA-binding protein H-NS